MNSLDPRVKRLPFFGYLATPLAKPAQDQLITFEVFVKPKGEKPFQHEGSLHAPDLEMAFVLAKETFTRRFTCTSLTVVETTDVYSSPTTDGNQSVLDIIEKQVHNESGEPFDIFFLYKRGKQHVYAGTLSSTSHGSAIAASAQLNSSGKLVYNVWAIRQKDMRTTSAEEQDLWNTLPEKKFRDASEYKGGEKLTAVVERQNMLR